MSEDEMMVEMTDVDAADVVNGVADVVSSVVLLAAVDVTFVSTAATRDEEGAWKRRRMAPTVKRVELISNKRGPMFQLLMEMWAFSISAENSQPQKGD
jgi:hypothetical protein